MENSPYNANVPFYDGAPELNDFEASVEYDAQVTDDFEDLAGIIREAGGYMNIGDLLDQVKETQGAEAMGAAIWRLYQMGEQHQVFMCDDPNEGRLTVTLRDKPVEEFKSEKWAKGFTIADENPEEDMVDEFDSHLPSNPKPADWHEVAKITGNTRILRNRRKMQQLANEVDKLRFERRIRKHIHEYLEQKGGTAGIIEIMSSVDARDGQAAANAAISLVHIMKAEGKVGIFFADRPYDFTIGEDHFSGTDKQIMVRLLRRRK